MDTVDTRLDREDSPIWTDGACGLGGASLSKYDTCFEHAEPVLAADGYPEWAVSAYLEQVCGAWLGRGPPECGPDTVTT